MKTSEFEKILQQVLGENIYCLPDRDENPYWFLYLTLDNLKYYEKGYNTQDMVVFKYSKGLETTWSYSVVNKMGDSVSWDSPKRGLSFNIFLRVLCHEIVIERIKGLGKGYS